MTAPQMKERPASMLRAMFAGFGSLMSVMDKVRSKPAADAPAAAATTQAPEATTELDDTAAAKDTVRPEAAPAEAPAEPEIAATVETAETETTAGPEAAATPEVTAEPEAVAEPQAAVAVETAETAVEPTSSAAPEASGALPLANYDELTVASLRARLRNLSNDDLTLLLTYEKEHENRPEVVKMLQNRLIKMTSSLPKLEA
ncbi:MAG: hypothetical protein ACRDOI_29200 [Trebonia sp.]